VTPEGVARALAAPGQPQAALAALDAALAAMVGHRLFTVLALDAPHERNRRFYSSRPAEYPVGGYKPVSREGEYYRTVIDAGEPRFIPDRAGIVRAFPDHALILSLGCESAVNMPIRWDGRTLGALNLLDVAGHYSEAQLPALRLLAALAIAPLLRILEESPT
jgi:GAF domain-containing protein